ncbi:tRNA 2-thiouridine(34) synthase MnmA, partial [bacterium]|nr:tRNA 2-thiouridine(34) synthase MnmA [bacterium]
MSGGVDSSVTAALLKRRGYDVIGVTMQLLPKEQEKQSACCNLDAICDAQRVAAKLNIPHYVLNIRDTFKEKVIDYFVDHYISGLTPNPCVECNRHIKFDELRRMGDDLGTDYVATGHYVRRTFSPKKGLYFLKKAKDLSKDQSYFLYMLNSESLSKTFFPLGGYLKTEIRAIADQLGLINAKKPDSQEICFVTKGTYKEFVEQQLDGKPVEGGTISDLDGKVLGFHSGIHHFTIGQRKGLGI